jgi:hypothetical protein
MPKKIKSQGGGININDVNGDLTVGGDAVGRDKVVSNSITIQQFVYGSVPLESQLVYFGKQIGLDNIRAVRYANSQYEAYCDVWKSLQALRLAGDDLWEKASSENLLAFAERLRQTQTIASEGDIFFEDKDRDDLLRVLGMFGRFYVGKERLINIRTKDQIDRWISDEYFQDEIGRQIARNREYKIQYEKLLERIRRSFRRRLSNQS